MKGSEWQVGEEKFEFGVDHCSDDSIASNIAIAVTYLEGLPCPTPCRRRTCPCRLAPNLRKTHPTQSSVPLPTCHSTIGIRQLVTRSGLEGSIPGNGSGSQQPAEALHAPWQNKLAEIGGKGNIEHVLGAMQNLYTEHWALSFASKDHLLTLFFMFYIAGLNSFLVHRIFPCP